MFPNAKPSELISYLGGNAPAQQSASTVTTPYVSIANFHTLLAIIETGVLGTSATVDAKLVQATDSSGTNSKDITGKAITQIVKASGDNKVSLINLRSSELDVAGGFAFVALAVTVGTAASYVGAQLLGMNSRFPPASDDNVAAVVQIVG